jgi:hypothetical protein
MSAGQIKTRVRGQAQPGQDNRFATAAGIPSHREKDDNYRSVVVRLSPRWRVIVCRDGAQWIIQKKEASHAGPWRGVSYHTCRSSLIRTCGSLNLLSEPSVTAILAALPDRIGGKHEQRAEPHTSTKINRAYDELHSSGQNSLQKG